MPGMRRREFITLLGGAAVAWPLAAHAQQGQRVRRIGVLMGLVASDPEAQSRVAAFEHGLRELGWVKGRELLDRVPLGRRRRKCIAQPRVGADRHGARPDLGQQHAGDGRAAGAEPGRANRVHGGDRAGRRRPRCEPRASGRQAHRLHQFGALIGAKWLELLKEISPRVSRAALVFNPDSAPFSNLFVRRSRRRRRRSRLTPIAAAVRDIAELDRGVHAVGREPNGGLIVPSDLGTTNHRETDDRAGGSAWRACDLSVS